MRSSRSCCWLLLLSKTAAHLRRKGWVKQQRARGVRGRTRASRRGPAAAARRRRRAGAGRTCPGASWECWWRCWQVRWQLCGAWSRRVCTATAPFLVTTAAAQVSAPTDPHTLLSLLQAWYLATWPRCTPPVLRSPTGCGPLSWSQSPSLRCWPSGALLAHAAGCYWMLSCSFWRAPVPVCCYGTDAAEELRHPD